MVPHADIDPGLLPSPKSRPQPYRIWSATKRLWSDPLSRNGLALLANTAVNGILGFGYWLIAARLFPTYVVGVAGALVAATTLFSGIGQLNLSGMLTRFLPTAAEKSRRLVLLTYIYATCASAMLAAISIAGIKIFSLRIPSLHLDIVQATFFVFAVAATAIFAIQDSVLIGLRRAVWVPVENGTFGIAKIAILFAIAPIRNAFALYTAWMIPLTLTIPVISAMLFYRFLPQARRGRRAVLFGRRTALLGREMRSKLIRFAIGDATGGLFTQTWMNLLPVLITASLGASTNAFYYTSFLISNTIDQVAINYASPLTVEGAHTPGEIATLIRLTLRQIFTIILPIIILLLFICPWILHVFGAKYVSATPLLRLLLIGCLPKAVSAVYYAYCRIERTTSKSAFMQAYVCMATLSAVMMVAHPFGLTGIGVVIMAIQASAGTASWWSLRREYHIERDCRQGRHRRPPDGNVQSEVTIGLPDPRHSG